MHAAADVTSARTAPSHWSLSCNAFPPLPFPRPRPRSVPQVILMWSVAGDLEVLVTPPVTAPQEYGTATPELRISSAALGRGLFEIFLGDSPGACVCVCVCEGGGVSYSNRGYMPEPKGGGTACKGRGRCGGGGQARHDKAKRKHV